MIYAEFVVLKFNIQINLIVNYDYRAMLDLNTNTKGYWEFEFDKIVPPWIFVIQVQDEDRELNFLETTVALTLYLPN